MAFILNATVLPSASLGFSFPTRPPTHLAAFSKALPLSVAADLSFRPSASPLSVLQRRPPPPPLLWKWALLAAFDEVSEVSETEGEPDEMPQPVETQLAASAAETAKGEDVFAVVMIGSRQYIVFPGRYLCTQRLKGANVNDTIILNKVLLVGTRTKTYIGQPVVTNAAVHAVVEEQGLDRKVIVFKYKKKKNYRRNIGHRQPNTRIRITGITGYQDFPFETLPEKVPA